MPGGGVPCPGVDGAAARHRAPSGGTEPISCTEPATGTGTFTVSVPRPAERGEVFSFGVGALNCSACYVRYEYVAR